MREVSPMPPLLSIIIPALNEADTLPALFGDLRRQQEISFEIIVGDGGSTDATPSIVTEAGARLVMARRGRGAQMNAAAAQAMGHYLLFLHADSRLDDPRLLSRAVSFLRQAAGETDRVAGHFRLRFLRSLGKNSLAYRYIEEKTALNRVNTTNGDQGLLLAKAFFDELGGFDERLPFLEDQRLAEKIRACGTLVTLPGQLATSARRFEAEGFHRRYLLMGIIMGMHSIGREDFFARTPGLYRVQHETGRLLLSPFFTLLWSMLRHDWGPAESIRIFYRLGRYIRQNAWQPFFFIDVCLRPVLRQAGNPFLRLHDRLVAPCIDFRLVDALVGLGCFFWYMVVLALYFRIAETIQGAACGCSNHDG